MAKRASTTKSGKTRTKKKAASKKPAKSSTKKKTSKKKTAKDDQAAESEVTMDRRRGERREEQSDAAPVAPAKLERRKKVNRRRQIDPTTCERDYSDDEVEFMNALDEYKRNNGRMFPTCSEVLEVIRSLGYTKLSPTELSARQVTMAPPAEMTPPSETNEWHADQENEELLVTS